MSEPAAKPANPKNAPFALYPIHEGLGLLFDLIDDAEAPLPPEEITARIKELFADQQDLFQEARKSVLNFNAQAKAAREESSRLADLARRSESHADRLKGMVMQAMELSGLKKVEFPTGGSLRVQANSAPSVKFEGDAETLPESFRKVKIEYSHDTEKILSADAMGIPLPEGVSVVKGHHIRLS